MVEMLVVISIIGLLSALATSAIEGIRGAGDFTSAISQISGVLEQARAYAMAKNTFVFVGFTEVDGNQAVTANPQVAGNGRVVVVLLASKDGTPGFDVNSADPGSSWSANYSAGSNLTMIHKPIYVNGIHLPAAQETTAANMARPALSSTGDLISGTAAQSATPLSLPLGSALGAGQYTFNRVIYFDPQGATHVQAADGSSAEAIDPYLELDIQPTHGDTLPAVSTANLAAIQIDGMTGAVRVYRP